MFEVLEDRTLLAGPSVYTVTDTTDNPNDAGSLRAIVNTANNDPNPAGSIIQFNPTDFSGAHTITLGSPLTLSETPGPEVIEGPGSLFLVGSGPRNVLTISGGCRPGVHQHDERQHLGTDDLGGSATTSGGGVSNSGTLTLTDCIVTGNSVNGAAGSTFEGGGIYSKGSLTVTDCTITGNSVNDGGGTARYGGGGIGSTGPLTVTGCTVTDNSVIGTGGKNYGGGIDSTGLSKLAGCTITGNSVNGSNENYGGGVDSEGPLTVTDCVITGNSNTSGDGGGIFNKASMTLEGCTVAHNLILGGTGGGIANDSSMTMDECAVIDNTVTSGIGGGIINTNTLTVADTAITGNSVICSDCNRCYRPWRSVRRRGCEACGVFSGLDIDAVGGTIGRAQEAGDALLHAVLVALQHVHAAVALFET